MYQVTPKWITRSLSTEKYFFLNRKKPKKSNRTTLQANFLFWTFVFREAIKGTVQTDKPSSPLDWKTFVTPPSMLWRCGPISCQHRYTRKKGPDLPRVLTYIYINTASSLISLCICLYPYTTHNKRRPNRRRWRQSTPPVQSLFFFSVRRTNKLFLLLLRGNSVDIIQFRW